MHSKDKGFTLIELVVVITILGILAAFAIPRFTQLDSTARVSAINALGGSVLSGAALAHAAYLAAGTQPSSVTMDNQTITLVSGFPDATATGIQNTLQNVSGFTMVPGTGTVTFEVTSAYTPANCSVEYTIASTSGTTGITTPATVSAPVTTGC